MRLPPTKINAYAQRYSYPLDSIQEAAQFAKDNGYLTSTQLHSIARWKSERRAGLTNLNDSDFVEEITRFSFSARHEVSRIGSLLLLKGVSYPTASVILHFCKDTSYPILDVRAIWSLGRNQPSVYSINYWLEYVKTCRKLAEKHGVSVRQLDKALWQYSKENQDVA